MVAPIGRYMLETICQCKPHEVNTALTQNYGEVLSAFETLTKALTLKQPLLVVSMPNTPGNYALIHDNKPKKDTLYNFRQGAN